MCGLAGIASAQPLRRPGPLSGMVRSLRHRGPDDEGYERFENCALGSRRLAIIDLPGGHQPMLDRGGRCAVVFNGEIYGHEALRRALEYPFVTVSDTEVILALYTAYGRDLASHLPGMFAFAIWDDDRRRLVCARDRFGEKPFFYATTVDGALVFASEIKAILASGLVDPIIDRRAVAHYLERVFVHPGQTVYRNIRTLPPGHQLVYQQGDLRVSRYWQPPEAADEGGSLDQAAERLRQLLTQAVDRQLRADVPVGTFLSGGLDSSCVTALARRSAGSLKSFCFTFGADSDSELPYARELAARHGVELVETSTAGVDIADLLCELPDVYDEPFADSSAVPTYLISKAARQEVKVVLTGDGADELLGGYLFWGRDFLAQRAHPWRHLIAKILGRAGRTSPLRRYVDFRRYFSTAELAGLGLGEDTAGLTDFRRYQSGTIDDVLRYDLEGYLPGCILVKTDRASMAHGLELRAPFLDVDLAAFCLSLPSRLKVGEREEKIVLRTSCRDLLPERIRRRDKQGFGGPMDRWLAEPRVGELLGDYLRDPRGRLFDLLSYDAVQPYLEHGDQRTWSLLMLALWLERQTSVPSAAATPATASNAGRRQ